MSKSRGSAASLMDEVIMLERKQKHNKQYGSGKRQEAGAEWWRKADVLSHAESPSLWADATRLSATLKKAYRKHKDNRDDICSCFQMISFIFIPMSQCWLSSAGLTACVLDIRKGFKFERCVWSCIRPARAHTSPSSEILYWQLFTRELKRQVSNYQKITNSIFQNSF